MAEVHPDPAVALSDSLQQMNIPQFNEFMDEVRSIFKEISIRFVAVKGIPFHRFKYFIRHTAKGRFIVMRKIVLLVGTGLIGGSIALAIRREHDVFIYGYDINIEQVEKALSLQVIDEVVTDLEVLLKTLI